jgi:hypothetical protein
MQNINNQNNQVKHDINSALSAILSSTELLIDTWEKDPELVKKLLPLIEKKVSHLSELFSQQSNKDQ